MTRKERIEKQARKIEGTEGEDHASFLARVVLKVTPKEYRLVDMAYDFAKRAHEKQCRESGARYFEHLRGAVIILIDEFGITDPELIISLWLHDCDEDTWLLFIERIGIIFGDRVRGIVETLTMPKANDHRFRGKAARKRWYYANLKAADVYAKIAKLIDRLQNTRALVACSREKQLRKVAETRRYILPLIDDVEKEFPRLGDPFREKFALALAKLA